MASKWFRIYRRKKNFLFLYLIHIQIQIINNRNNSITNKQLYEKICKELPSVYFNNDIRQIIEERDLSSIYELLFKMLCKKYNEDGMLSRVADTTAPTIFK